MRILITRPQENATILINRLQELGHHIAIDPLIHFIPIPRHLLAFPDPSCFEAIITTSQQAIRCLANLTPQRHFPLWCVGTESAKIAQELEFQNIHTAGGNAQNLIAKLLKTFTSPLQKPLLHVSGDVIRVNIADALQENGILTQRIVVYETKEAQTFLHETQCALTERKFDTVLLYSPRTARIFRNLCQAAGLAPCCTSLTALCLSEEVAGQVRDLPWKILHVAKKTSTDELLMVLMMSG